MKKLPFIIIYLLFAIDNFGFAKATHHGPCRVPNVINQLHLSPVIVFAKCTKSDTTGYRLQVLEVIKGKNVPKTIDKLNIILDENVPIKKVPLTINETQLYYLYLQDGVWQLNYGWCSPKQFCYRNGKVDCGEVSVAEFKAGVTLFLQNYDAFLQKIRAGKKITVPKKNKNKAYRYLITQFNYLGENQQ